MIDKDKIILKAKEIVEQEQFDSAVNKEVKKLKWPWYKKLWPFKIKITIKDLRKD